jgi:hypothetical protein
MSAGREKSAAEWVATLPPRSKERGLQVEKSEGLNVGKVRTSRPCRAESSGMSYDTPARKRSDGLTV